MENLRRSAFLIAAAVVVPLILFLLFESAFSAREKQRVIQARALLTSELLMANVDSDLKQTMIALEVLGTAQSIKRLDMPAAYARAREIQRFNSSWLAVELLDGHSGRMLFDTRRRLGSTDLGRPSGDATGDPRNFAIERDGAGCPCVLIDQPAQSLDGNRLTVRALVSARAFLAMLPATDSDYPVSALVNPEGRFIARSLDQQKRAGTFGSAYLRAAVAGGRESGFYSGTTLEGLRNYSAFRRSPITGWSVHVALPADNLDTPARRFLTSLGAAAVLSLLLAALLVWFALRQIAAARAMAERIQQAQKMEALGQLTGGIAHDFNNLLTPIVGALDFIMSRGEMDARSRRLADGALGSARRASKLTAQLLAFSRRQKLHIAPVDIPQLFDEMRPIVEQSVGRDHRVELIADPRTGCALSDDNQLELAILNLVLNARDAMPGGGLITVDAARHPDNEDKVLIRVRDAGEGMSEEVRQRAFEPFFTTKIKGAGSGLGLAQVFGIVAQSGGTVAIDSAPGEGTTVSLTLERCEPAEITVSATVAATPTESRKLAIFVVDDQPAVRDAIAEMLGAEGHSVTTFADGQSVLAAIGTQAPDALVVDFAMPQMDGAEVIRRTRALIPNLPVLMVTGYADSDALAAAGDDYTILRKPFDAAELTESVAVELAR